jgi:hypothetical protein
MDPDLKQTLEPFADPVQKSSDDSYAKAKKKSGSTTLSSCYSTKTISKHRICRYHYEVNRYRYNAEDIGINFSDPHHFRGDPDPALHSDTNKGSVFNFDACPDPDPTSHFMLTQTRLFTKTKIRILNSAANWPPNLRGCRVSLHGRLWFGSGFSFLDPEPAFKN